MFEGRSGSHSENSTAPSAVPTMPASLRYSEPAASAIRRRRRLNGWVYVDEDGNRISEEENVRRLNAFALRSDYRDARFCTDPRGRLQAIGNDARNRRQYRYHADYRVNQDAAKFAQCLAFGTCLPTLRRAMETHLQDKQPTRTAVIAAIVRILGTAYLRIGNEEYCRAKETKRLPRDNRELLNWRGDQTE